MNHLRLAASIVYRDLAIDVVDPVVRGWLRSVLFGALGILIGVTVITPSILDLIIPLAMLYLLLLVEWHALRPHILFHPAVRSWIERDIRIYHAIRITIGLLIFTGLLPIVLVLGLLLLLGHAVLFSGIAPPPTTIVDTPPSAGTVQAAPAAMLAARSEAFGLMDRGRAPPTATTNSTALSTVTSPGDHPPIWPFAALIAIPLLVGRILVDHVSASPCATRIRAASPRAPPAAA